jgi:hypothetical protein
MHRCSTKWATYLMSLESLVETGTGTPSPHDVHVAFPECPAPEPARLPSSGGFRCAVGAGRQGVP